MMIDGDRVGLAMVTALRLTQADAFLAQSRELARSTAQPLPSTTAYRLQKTMLGSRSRRARTDMAVV